MTVNSLQRSMDDDWLQAEIDRQLSAISLDDSDLDDEDDEYSFSDNNININDDSNSVLESLLEYSRLTEDHMKQFSLNLTECDNVLKESDRGWCICMYLV